LINTSDEARGLWDRGKSSSRPHVDLVPLRAIGVKALVRVLPREPVLLDEVSITPSKRWQKADAKRQAKQVLAQAKAGQRVRDADVSKLQQRLLTLERQDELAGRESEGKQLAFDLGEVRRSKLVGEAMAVLARPKEKKRFDEKYIDRLQQRLLGMERQDELVGRESEGRQLALALGEVRRTRLVAEASDVLAKAKAGGRYDLKYINELQQRLLSMESQDELSGRESEGKQLALALGEVRRSRLVAEALEVLAKAKEGRRFSADHVAMLQKLLLSMERGDALSGRESEGFRLAAELAEIRR
jgi:hypothetical protein